MQKGLRLFGRVRGWFRLQTIGRSATGEIMRTCSGNSWAWALAMLLAVPSAHAGSVPVFTDDFDSGISARFSGITTIEPTQGFIGTGNGANVFSGNFLRNASGGNPTGAPGSPTVLTLTDLPTHTSIDLKFLLAIIDTWDGSDPASGAFQPDYFNVRVDGTTIFSESIDHEVLAVGTYGNPAPGVLIAWGNRFEARPSQNDIGFDMGLEPVFSAIPHSAGTLVVEWFADGAGWQGNFGPEGAPDESWAIDNVAVVLNGVEPVPEPATFALLGLGLAGLGFSRRRP
jgi:hypothetical protein